MTYVTKNILDWNGMAELGWTVSVARSGWYVQTKVATVLERLE